MQGATIEKEVCEKCGVDVRENTVFCYNCGSPVGEDSDELIPEEPAASNGDSSDLDAETQAALQDLAQKFKIDEEADNKLAKAAAERKKARVGQRKSKEFVWEPSDDSSGRLLFLGALLVAAAVAAVVFLTVFWK